MTPQRQDSTRATEPARTGVVVLGSLNMDISVTVQRLPEPGETVIADSMSQHPGGKGANQAVAAARLGGDVRLIGRLGEDDHGNCIRMALDDAGVDLRHVRTTDHATGQAFVTVDSRGENVIVVASGANADINAAAVQQEADVLETARIAVTQLETPLDAVARFADLCSDVGVDLILNAAPYRQVPENLLRRCRYLILNRDEATSLTGVIVQDRASAGDAAVEATRLGADRVVITLGGQGCVALADGQLVHLDAYRVPVTDTTGAGDAFVGAFAVALSRGGDLDDALRFAAAAGAVACAGAGAQSLTSPNETQRLLEEQPPTLRHRPVSDLYRTIVASDR